MKINVISQYTSLLEEIKEIEQDIERKQKEIQHMESIAEKERVKGGYGGKQHYIVDGYAKADIEETEYLINKNIRLLKERRKKVQEIIIEIEEFINTINDSRMRRMISLKYIKGKTWYQVAQAMGKYYTQDSCKKQVQRFLNNM